MVLRQCDNFTDSSGTNSMFLSQGVHDFHAQWFRAPIRNGKGAFAIGFHPAALSSCCNLLLNLMG